VGDGTDEIDGFGDGVGVLGVLGVVAFDEDDVGAELFGFADLRSGFDAEGFGLVAGGYANGGIGEGGDYGEGFSAVLRVELLFDGRKEAVEVDVKVGEAIGMGAGGHERRNYYIRLLFASIVPV
jgi:hypothetical protein